MFDIPTELMLKIFKNLDSNTLMNCRVVCQRWKDIADADEVWKHRCYIEHGEDSGEAFRKASLTWRQLFVSLHLWKNIANAKVKQYNTANSSMESRKIPYIPDNVAQKFVTLENGIVSMPDNSMKDEGISYMSLRHYDRLVYYDVKCLKKIKNVECEPFIDYHETEEYIMLINVDSQLILMPKLTENNDNINLGCVQRITLQFVYFICHNNVIYVRIDGNLSHIKVNFENNNVVTEIKKLFNIEKYWAILDIAIDANTIKILSRDGIIDTYRNNVLENSNKEICETRSRKVVHECLIKYGFNLSSVHVQRGLQYNIMLRRADASLVRWSRTKLLFQSKTVLVNTCRHEIAIVYNPYVGGKLNLYNANPVSSFIIDSMDLIPKYTRRRFGNVSQMDIIEIENGHLIIILFCTILFVFECTHTHSEVLSNKRINDIGVDVNWIPKRVRRFPWALY